MACDRRQRELDDAVVDEDSSIVDGDEDEVRVEASTMPDRADAASAETSRRRSQRRRRRLWIALALAPALILAIAFGLDRWMHTDRVLRGVRLGDRALAGMDGQQLAGTITALEERLRGTAVTLAINDKTLELKAGDLGLSLAGEEIAAEAMRSGRNGSLIAQLSWWLQSFNRERALTARCNIDDAALDAALVPFANEAIPDPPFEGSVVVRDARPAADPPRAGRVLDRRRASGLIAEAMCAQQSTAIDVPLMLRDPVREASATAAALELAERLLDGPITLRAELPPAEPKPGAKRNRARAPKPKSKDGEPTAPRMESFTFSRELLAKALRSRPTEGSGIEVYLDRDVVDGVLDSARASLERPPADAKFVIERKDVVRIEPSRAASVIDVDKVSQALLRAASSPSREGELPVEIGAQPTFSTKDAEKLAIAGLVSKFTTMHPCCRPRVKNIHRMADLIDGVLLKPGETYSINEHVGERRAKNGFVAAPTIVHGEMKDTIGGGVSQFATTFFNAAFYGAYEIVERQPHSFYFDRYPMGHEATLSYPKPDVIIRNDTDAGLLIKTYYTGASITVKLYGDNGGRKVKRRVSRVYDVTKPPIEYIADPSLEPDEHKVKVRGKVGWSVSVSRTVIYPDGRKAKQKRKVIYKPRVRKLRVHPCKIPEGEDGYTAGECPEPEEEEDEEEGEGAEGVEGDAGDEEAEAEEEPEGAPGEPESEQSE